MRIRESRVLLDAQMYSGAYYLMGYAIECALKACVAKQTKRYDFPDKKKANDVYTHDLIALVKCADLSADLESDISADRSLLMQWSIVKNWSESSRYDTQKTKSEAQNLFKACERILKWIKERW